MNKAPRFPHAYRMTSPRERFTVAHNIYESAVVHGITPDGLVSIAGEMVSPWGALLWYIGDWDERHDPTPYQFLDRLIFLRRKDGQPEGDGVWTIKSSDWHAVNRQMEDWRRLASEYQRTRAYDRRVLQFLSFIFGVKEQSLQTAPIRLHRQPN